jgi:hypothetical protein
MARRSIPGYGLSTDHVTQFGECLYTVCTETHKVLNLACKPFSSISPVTRPDKLCPQVLRIRYAISKSRKCITLIVHALFYSILMPRFAGFESRYWSSIALTFSVIGTVLFLKRWVFERLSLYEGTIYILGCIRIKNETIGHLYRIYSCRCSRAFRPPLLHCHRTQLCSGLRGPRSGQQW